MSLEPSRGDVWTVSLVPTKAGSKRGDARLWFYPLILLITDRPI